MNIVAIDPGTTESQLIVFDGKGIVENTFAPNSRLLYQLSAAWSFEPGSFAVIESIASYGMPVGKEVFRTCFWTGCFYHELNRDIRVRLVPRLLVKTHLCHSARAKDGNIRQALIDRFGGTEKAIGKKKAPGVLYGVKAHGWAALALAVTAWDIGQEIGESLEQ